MSPSNETLRRYLSEMQDIELPDDAITRLTTACAAVAGVAAESLFDTEPEQLHSVLDELANEADS